MSNINLPGGMAFEIRILTIILAAAALLMPGTGMTCFAQAVSFSSFARPGIRIEARSVESPLDSEGREGRPPTGLNKLAEALSAETRFFFDLPALSRGNGGNGGNRGSESDGGKVRESKTPREVWQPLPEAASGAGTVVQPETRPQTTFNWENALRESMIFLGIQHAFRLATEQGSRADLKGPFFRDYFRTLARLRGWDDGDPFIVNYIGHPMMGSVASFIQIQNDPAGINEEVSLRRSYWKSRLKAFGWSFAYSTQFELGLISEATLGNVGIRPYDGRKNPMAYVDLVITPVVGSGWQVGEDLLDKYLIRRLESRVTNKFAFILFRSFLNPTRSFANIMRGKLPWHRDNRR